jgi:DNA-binding response OmpR family regulator
MLVDDDHTTASLLKKLLELDGFEVILSPGGDGALDKVKETKPEVFLVDYHLADHEGTEFVQQVRALADFAKTPIIMTSGLDHTEDAMAAGATEFLIKPFDPPHLIARLNALLETA